MTLVRINHTAYSRLLMMTALIAFRSAFKFVQLQIMHRGLYSARLLGMFLSSFVIIGKSFHPKITDCMKRILFICIILKFTRKLWDLNVNLLACSYELKTHCNMDDRFDVRSVILQ